MTHSSPDVSIVIATYNRSNVLRLAIESARTQTVTNWEMLVIGDACTDDTAAVVASFDDPRISFINLPRNHGEQSAPNNEGIRRGRGRYLALLNHDDLWLSDHLARCVALIEESGADLAYALTLAFDHRDEPHLAGAARDGRYEPFATALASSWVMRRELMDEIGPWRSARTLHVSPSMDWIFRAWKRGKDLRCTDVVSVIAIHSGSRLGSYAERESLAYERTAAALRDDPRFVERALTRIATRNAAGASRAIAPHLVRAAKNGLRRLSLLFGVHPATLHFLVRYRRRGGFIDKLRKIRGLPPLIRNAERES
jgi:glycosyltransferase involved in cell wall biosynthesis